MVTPEESIRAVNDLYGAHAGYRALHAKGTLLKGTFTATPEAARLTRAAHLRGGPVPALVRFSNGGGNPHVPDKAQDIRGMAVKFTLPDGSRTDISAQSAELLPVRTPDDFVELVRLAKVRPSSVLRFPVFLARNPALLRTLPANRQVARVPESFATTAYHAVHAFKWLDTEGGSRFVRYRWVPEAGVRHLGFLAALRKDRDFLFEEIAARLDSSPVRFSLQVRIAGPGHDPTDPTRRWKGARTVTVGTLEITGPETGRETGGDVVVFDPMRVTDGIAPSDDAILQFRTHSYSVSVERRAGVPRGPEAPPL